jgi:hypothetical protein
MTLTPTKRVVLSLSGYALAWSAGVIAVWLKNLGIDPAVITASSGMFAFGDTFLFLIVAGVVAIVPSILLLGFIKPENKFWWILSSACLIVATTGMAAGLLLSLQSLLPGPPTQLHGLAILRSLSAPVLFLLYAPGVTLTRGRDRKRLAVALLFEMVAACGFVVHILLHR